MGNALQTVVQTVQEQKGKLSNMQEYINECYTISMLGKPDDHYMFYGMSRNEYQAVFNVAKLLNL